MNVCIHLHFKNNIFLSDLDNSASIFYPQMMKNILVLVLDLN